ISTQPPGLTPRALPAGTTAGSPARISFGRPVDPPDVGAFHELAAAGGSGSSLRPGSGSRPAAQVTRPGTRSESTPTTSAESASSTIVASSRPGRRAETGCGTAPSFQQATAASRNSTEFGSAIATRSSWPTPAAPNARASRLLRRSSWSRVTEAPATVIAGRSGFSLARRPSAWPIGSGASLMSVEGLGLLGEFLDNGRVVTVDHRGGVALLQLLHPAVRAIPGVRVAAEPALGQVLLEHVPHVVQVGVQHEVPGVLRLDLHGQQARGVAGHVPHDEPVEQLGLLTVQRLPVELPVQVPGQVSADVLPGGHRVVVLLDLLLVGVDGDVRAGELLQAAGVVEVQVAHDDRADVADAVADRRQRVVEVMLVVVDIARERVPRGRRPFVLGILGAAGIEQDRPGL